MHEFFVLDMPKYFYENTMPCHVWMQKGYGHDAMLCMYFGFVGDVVSNGPCLISHGKRVLGAF